MEDTIAAIATAYGEGGIGIIRISGDRAGTILDQIFTANFPVQSNEADFSAGIINDGYARKKRNIQHTMQDRRMSYGHIIDRQKQEIVDEVLAVYMKAPHTYTREDVVEINCHGSMISLRKTLELIIKFGARMAEPGEFTKRAFLNGRLDLSQAEAVIDMVKAKTNKGYEVSVAQLSGSLSNMVRSIRDELLKVLAHVIVNLDYPDADIEELSYKSLKKSLKEIQGLIDGLVETAETGMIIKEGLKTVIIGKPNVGKSSLMNALLKEARAIVTEIPGTTRDTIEEIISLKNIPIRLIDTAGIRETEDSIEKIGIARSKDSFNGADLVIFVLNASEELSFEDLAIMDYVREKKAIVLFNKVDLGQKLINQDVLDVMPHAIIINTVITENQGIEELETVIFELVYGGKVKQQDSMMITNLRHKDLLQKASQCLADALLMVQKMEALDFIEVDIKRSWELLGEIVGETVSEDIIDQVFSRFCLGK